MFDRCRIASIVALCVAGTVPAAAQEGVFMRDLLGTMGLVEKDQAPIHYRERAPLVLPPSSSLPPPTSRSSLRGANPQWPTDPEITSRERRAVAAREPIRRGYSGRMNDNNATLSIDEIRSGRRAGAGVPTENVYKPGDNTRQSTWLDPFELLSGKKDDDETRLVTEPDRVLLSQPPRGYMAPPNGRLEKTAKEPAPYNPDRRESDAGEYVRQQARR